MGRLQLFRGGLGRIAQPFAYFLGANAGVVALAFSRA